MKRAILAGFGVLLGAWSRAAALSIDDLRPEEKPLYQQALNDQKDDSTALQHFLYTREYVRIAKGYLARAAARSGGLPEKTGDFDERYLLPGEQETVDAATEQALLNYTKRKFAVA